MWLADLATPPDAAWQRVPVATLAAERGIPSSKKRLLERYFGLHSAAIQQGSQMEMLLGPLAALLARHPGLAARPGVLVHVRTQTHATPPCAGGLARLARAAGLRDWEVFAQTQTHCAGGLAAVHLMPDFGPDCPVIVLTGEKCFHPVTANQPGAVLGEMPVAALFRPASHQAGGWRVAASHVAHLPQFNANPHRMADPIRKEWERSFGDYLSGYVEDVLTRFGLTAQGVDLVVPYNLNLPLLDRIAQAQGWQDRIYTDSLSTVGHLFCADVFYNLAQVLPQAAGPRVLCFAAGMGATFAAILLEKVADHDLGRPQARSRTPALA